MNYLEYDYDEDTMVSTCTIGTKWGTFTANAKVNESDVDVASRYSGPMFAEIKCLLKVAYAKKKAMYQRYIGALNASKVFEEGTAERKKIDRQVKKAYRDYVEAKAECKSYRDNYADIVENTNSERRRMREKYARYNLEME